MKKFILELIMFCNTVLKKLVVYSFHLRIIGLKGHCGCLLFKSRFKVQIVPRKEDVLNPNYFSPRKSSPTSLILANVIPKYTVTKKYLLVYGKLLFIYVVKINVKLKIELCLF